jgi:hypothetical protein
MNHSHTLPVTTGSRVQRLLPVAFVVLAIALVGVALIQPGSDEPASVKVATPTPAQPATAARPDESGIATAIAPRSDAGVSESAIAAALGRGGQSNARDDGAVERRWKAYDESVRSLVDRGEIPLAQIKHDAQYLRGH